MMYEEQPTALGTLSPQRATTPQARKQSRLDELQEMVSETAALLSDAMAVTRGIHAQIGFSVMPDAKPSGEVEPQMEGIAGQIHGVRGQARYLLQMLRTLQME